MRYLLATLALLLSLAAIPTTTQASPETSPQAEVSAGHHHNGGWGWSGGWGRGWGRGYYPVATGYYYTPAYYPVYAPVVAPPVNCTVGYWYYGLAACY